ncbi:MAG: sigma-54-dependent transcriptional regulator [Planctomycetota bacterium]
MSTILIVDDEPNVLASFQKMLATQKHRVMTAARGEAALALVEKKKPDLLVMDIRMPGMDGLTAFRKLRETHPKLPVIIMTGFGTTEAAIEATKLGAFDYHLKPFEPADMLRSIKGALESARLMRRHVRLDPDSEAPSADAIIGQSEGMRGVYKAIGRVAETDATVLVAEMPLVVVNCVAIPETLLESELFGHEKGAFTGASARRIGKFEQAAGGTIFLDEIGDMPLSIQSKMLRVLQERSLERVGGHNTISVDVRVIAATNRDLEKAIAEGKFRDDLYHRLDVFTIDLPPLRERREDIPRLVAYFLDRFARELGVEKPVLSEPALEALRGYGWPGNVRELEHCIHRAMIFTRGYPIQPDDIHRALERSAGRPATESATRGQDRLRETVQEYLKHRSGTSTHTQFLETVDKLLVAEALKLTQGNQTRAAKLLGLTRPTLQAKMQKYGLRRQIGVRED